MVALVLLLGAIGLVHTIFPFLAVTHRVDADVLVVEGWVHEHAIRTAISEFQSGHYQRVLPPPAALSAEWVATPTITTPPPVSAPAA